MNNKMIHFSKPGAATPTGSDAHKGLYPTLRILTTLVIMTLTATMAWAANNDATTLSTGIDDAPPLYEEATDWTTLKSLVEAGGTVKLTNNVTRNANQYIEVTKAVTLDLNGHTIYGYETGSSTHYNNTPIFSVYEGGNLTITDGSAGKGGKITNVWGTSAIRVGGTDDSHGEATFEAGTIASGGVSIYGYGKFTMTGGTITSCSEGVKVDENATFTMTGGTITGNGEGVNILSYEYSPTFTVSGNVNITGNTERDVSLDFNNYNNFNPIHIGDTLASTARIGVGTDKDADDIEGKTFTEGLNGNGSRVNFVSNNNELEVVTTASGELALRTSITAHQATFNGVTKYWATFYHPYNRYRLPEGSQAFYVKGNDNALYLLGDDGNVIPDDYAVIIMSDTDRIGLDKLGPWDVYVDKPDDNKLIGTDGPKNVSDVYVLSEVDGVLGFYKFTGEIPAHRAYYVE